MLIETPAKYKVTLVDTITFAMARAIKGVFMSAAKFESGSDKPGVASFSGDVVIQAQNKAIETLVTNIERPDGTQITSNFLAEIDNWPVEDGELLVSKIDELTATLSPGDSKKKT